jgi:hypothetical protein
MYAKSKIKHFYLYSLKFYKKSKFTLIITGRVLMINLLLPIMKTGKIFQASATFKIGVLVFRCKVKSILYKLFYVIM